MVKIQEEKGFFKVVLNGHCIIITDKLNNALENAKELANNWGCDIIKEG